MLLVLNLWFTFSVSNRTFKYCLEYSLLEEIHIILLKQPSKHLLELFDKQPKMIHVALGLCQGLIFPFKQLSHWIENMSFTHEYILVSFFKMSDYFCIIYFIKNLTCQLLARFLTFFFHLHACLRILKYPISWWGGFMEAINYGIKIWYLSSENPSVCFHIRMRCVLGRHVVINIWMSWWIKSANKCQVYL